MKRRIFALLAFSLPLLGLLVLEAGLRLFGFGQSYPLFVEVEQAPSYLRVNPRVVRRFIVDEADTPNLWIRPVFFPRKKAPGTFRIFVQGGSTAAGYPYGYGASPAGMLQQRLQRTFPRQKIEVITTAVSAVNSYTLRDFTGEIIEQSPDAVLIYAGHNEYVGILGVGSGYSAGRRRPVVLTFLWLRDVRLFQLVQRAVGALQRKPEKKKDPRRTLMATIVKERRIPYGSPLYLRGIEQYRTNLRDILKRYRQAGVAVFIGTLASNERGQPPFISGHSPGADAEAWKGCFERGKRALDAGEPLAALAEFNKAVEIDGTHAQGHYWRAKALERLGRHPEARQAYLDAKDRDQLRFRAPEEINQVIREVAAEQGARVVEVQQALVREASQGIVGNDLMLEHLHPNLTGYFLMADAFYEALRAEGMIGAWENAVEREEAWKETPVTEVDRLYGEWRTGYLMSDWPFTEKKRAFQILPPANRLEKIALDYYKGRQQWPDVMRRLLNHYRAEGDDFEASRVAVLLAEAFPYQSDDQTVAAEFLLRAKRPGAGVYLERAIESSSAQRNSRLLAIRRYLDAGEESRALERLNELNQ